MSMYMRIDGTTPKGAATVDKINGKDGFFAIEAVSWGARRGVGIDVGNANNADQGMVGLNEIEVARACDGATPYLTTFLYAPGPEGKVIEIVITKVNREGSAAAPYLIMTLQGARVSSYTMTATNGADAQESFTLTYTQISKAYYIEGADGRIEKGPEVGFDATTAKVTSTAS